MRLTRLASRFHKIPVDLLRYSIFFSLKSLQVSLMEVELCLPRQIVPVPCLDDNYAYVLYDVATKKAALVDPVNPEAVLKQVLDLIRNF